MFPVWSFIFGSCGNFALRGATLYCSLYLALENKIPTNIKDRQCEALSFFIH